jgi:hypothetical protein
MYKAGKLRSIASWQIRTNFADIWQYFCLYGLYFGASFYRSTEESLLL